MKPISKVTIESELIRLKRDEKEYSIEEKAARNLKDYKKANSLKKEIYSIKKYQHFLINRTVENIAVFQRAGELIRDNFRDKSKRLYYAPHRKKEIIEKRFRENINYIIELKKNIAKEDFSNHSKNIEVLVDEIINQLASPKEGYEIRKIIHRDFGLHHINEHEIIFDLGDFGLGREEADLAGISNSPLVAMTQREFEKRYFKFFALKYPDFKAEGVGKDIRTIRRKLEKNGVLSKEENKRLGFYASHLRTLYRNKIYESIRVLGTMARNILKDPQQQIDWMSKYKGVLTEGDLIAHHFNELKGTLNYMLGENHISYIFHSNNRSYDIKSIERIDNIEGLVKDLNISHKGRKKIREYLQNGS